MPRIVAPACHETCREMVPSTLKTHLDCIAAELIDPLGELVDHRFRINDSAGKLFQLVAVDISNEPKRFSGAHRTGSVELLTYVLRRSRQFGMRVTNIETVNRSLTEAPQ